MDLWPLDGGTRLSCSLVWLREMGQDPVRVANVEAAWQAFRSFLARPIEGLEPDPDSDADGLMVQWGRYGWNDRRPSLVLMRQMGVDARATWTSATSTRLSSGN